MKAAEIAMIIYDCDGVLTDNRVIVDENGKESAVFHRGDGFAVSAIAAMGIRQMILSTEENPIVRERAAKLKIPVIYRTKDKKGTLRRYCEEQGIRLERVLYIGNDLNDLDAMLLCGHRGCPADAEPEIRSLCDWVSSKNGGYGVVRELYRMLSGSDVE